MSRYINLFSIIDEIYPKIIMEIGTWNGIHAMHMIKAAQKFWAEKKTVEYYGFDLFEDFRESENEFCPKSPAKMVDAATRIGSTDCTYQLIKGNTKDTLPKFERIKYADFIFIDGGHSIETIESDWINIQRFITSKTVVLFDDYYPDNMAKGCKSLIDPLVYNSNWLVEVLEPIDYFPKTNVTVQMVRVEAN